MSFTTRIIASDWVGDGGELTASEELLVQALNSLGTSGAGEFIRKTGATSFANATPAGGGGGAPTTAKYWVSESDATLSAEVNLGALSTGMLKHTVSGGISTPSVAVADTDYLLPTTAASTYAPLLSPSLTTPSLGVATATSINKVAITAPATSATLTIADGATLSAPSNATVSGTNTGDQTNITGNAGTVTNGVYTTDTGTVFLAPNGSGAALTGITSSQVSIPTSGSPVDTTNAEDWWRHSWSTGLTDGGDITTNGGAGTVDIAANDFITRAGTSEDSPLTSYRDAGTTGLALTANEVSYVYRNYNGGTPTWQAGTALADFNGIDKVITYVVARNGTRMNVIDVRSINVDSGRKNRRQKVEFDGYVYNGFWRSSLAQSPVSNSGLSVLVGAGKYFYFDNPITHSAFDTTVAGTADANVFKYFYNRTGSWTQIADSKTINNTQYDNAGTLTALTVNRYRTDWVYTVMCANSSNCYLAVVMGNAQYTTLASAQAAPQPTTLPPQIDGIAVLVGQIVAQEGSTTLTIENAGSATFTGGAASTTHNNLSGIQGGTTAEYYHLTSAEYTGTGTGAFVRAASPTITGTTILDNLQTSGSSGIAFKNSGGTTVGTFGSAGTTNVSFTGAVNVNSLSSTTTLAATTTISTGAAAGTTGKVNFVGTTSGTVGLSVADAAGTWTMKLPTTAGTNGYFLQTDGSGNTTWAAASGGLSWNATANGATGTGLALSMDNSYAASGIGQSITIGNTQTQALKALKIDLGTSNPAHNAIDIVSTNVGTYGGNLVGISTNNGRGIKITQAAADTNFFIGLDITTFAGGTADSTAISITNSQSTLTSKNRGIYVSNASTANGSINTASFRGVGVGVYQTGSGGVAMWVLGGDNVNSSTNGLVNYTLSNTQSGASVVQKIDTGTSAQGHTAYLAQIYNASSTATAFSALLSSTGTGRVLTATGTSIANIATWLEMAHTPNGSLTERSSPFVRITSTRTNTATSGTRADNFNMLHIEREQTQNGAGGTFTSTGSVLSLENITAQTAGTMTDSVAVLKLTQDNDSTGGHILFNAYSGTPTTNGTMYFDGTNMKIRVGGATKTFTII